MKVIRTIKEIQSCIHNINKEQKQIGFVATMGYFHDGHLSLMKEARKDSDVVITSIFVNPLQFGPNEDYETYPRNEQRDLQLAEENGVDIVFLPASEVMYPQQPVIQLNIEKRADVLCGKSRPGHFNGVLMVLTKLFHILRPHTVYFGMKDAQQVAVVDALITDLNFPIELVGVNTVREEDGLAKSSRNVFLSGQERAEAVWLYKALKKGKQLVVDGEKNPAMIIKEVQDMITRETSGKIDYVELYSYPDLTPVTTIDRRVILAVAVHFNNARLIDNVIFNETGEQVSFIN